MRFHLFYFNIITQTSKFFMAGMKFKILMQGDKTRLMVKFIVWSTSGCSNYRSFNFLGTWDKKFIGECSSWYRKKYIKIGRIVKIMIQTRFSNLIDFPQRVLLNMDQLDMMLVCLSALWMLLFMLINIYANFIRQPYQHRLLVPWFD